MKNPKDSKRSITLPLLYGGMSVLSAAVCALLIAFAKTDASRTCVVTAIVYVVAVAILTAVATVSRLHEAGGDEGDINPFMNNLTLDFMNSVYLPILICDERGKIIWYNSQFSTMTSETSLYGKNFSSVCDTPLDDIRADTSEEGQVLYAYGTYFAVKSYMLRTDQKDFIITVWADRSELEEAYRQLEEENTVVAYIMIDNLDELLQYVQEKYRTASSDTENILKEWSDSIDGVFKEYERDRFLLMFASSHLQDLIDRKFDILDKIREVRVGESSLPVTVSIGIAAVDGTLAEKEKAAHAALDLALQRGGDQVVVKRDGDVDFYGGRSQTVQRRTKVRARVVANELATRMSKSSNVIVMGHIHPDYDAIGACIGLARFAMFCGVPVNIITHRNNPNMKKCLELLENVDDYSNDDIFIDVQEAQEMLRSDTLLIITDVNNRTQFASPEIADNAQNIVVIDHHRKSPDFSYEPVITYIEPAASSACELTAELLEQALPAGTMKREESNIMLAGIMLDTKQFSRNTGSRTFGAALYLRNEGANPVETAEMFKTDLKELTSEAKYESNVIIYRSIIAIAQNDVDGAERIAAAKAADRLLSVEGVAASFVICRLQGSIHISARSAGSINVQLILEKLGGGGHFDSAATQFKNITMTEALSRLKTAIDEYIDESSHEAR